ncbi:MAG TPA: response regulator transcription factor [Smithellaceae bacterium]|nr:response regulator transcription factor [Smithellaceae bacterium]HRS83048.1 response regulator transcription factor [Smithellaceae bacterium]HRV44997.1 response regulator transcription factor [Smithellaceae bacterium]
MALRVLLADDHALFRAGMKALLARLPDIDVVAEAGDGRETLAQVEAHQPDVVLIDIAMKGMNGLEATSRIVKAHPRIKVLILSMHATEAYVLEALRSGASGYLIKDAGTEELALALTAVRRGETYLSPPVSRHVIAEYVRRTGGETNLADTLSPRQREILQLIAEGNSTKDIAGLLGLSVKTVDTHRTQLMERLDIHDVAGLVRFAVRAGIVSS